MPPKEKGDITTKLSEMLSISQSNGVHDRIKKEFTDVIDRFKCLIDKNPLNTEEKNILFSSLSFQLNHLLTQWDFNKLSKSKALTRDKQSMLSLLHFLKKAQDVLNAVLQQEYNQLDPKTLDQMSKITKDMKQVTETLQQHKVTNKLKSRL